MNRLNRLSLKTRLLLLVLAIALPAAAVIVASSLKVQRHRTEEARGQARHYLEGIAARQVEIAADARKFLATVAEVPAVQRRDAAACNALFKRLLVQHPQYGNLLALTPDGRGFASAVPLTKRDFSDRKYYRDLIRRGAFTAGEYAEAHLMGRPVIHFAHPVTDRRGRLAAVLVAALPLDQPLAFFLNGPLPPGFSFGVADHQGIHLVGQTLDPDNRPGTALPSHLWQDMQADRDQALVEARCTDGVTRLHAYRKVRLQPGDAPYLFVYLSVEEDRLLAGVRKERYADLSLLGLILLLASGLALLLGRRGILAPLERLSLAAGAIAAGRYDTRTEIDHGDAEVGALARAFDAMAAQVEGERRQLRESEERYRTLVELSPDIIFIHDGETVQFINRTGAEKLGTGDPAAMIGQPIWAFIPPADHPLVRQQIGLGHQVRTREGHYLHPDGTPFPVEVIGVRLTWGERPAHLVISRDISRRRRLEQQLRQSQKLEAIGTLAGGIAHDFNNILGAIFGYTELALDGTTGERQRRDLQAVLKAAERARDLVNQLLAFSRGRQAERQPLDLGTTVREALKLVRATIPQSVQIDREGTPDPLTVLADATQVHQVLLNLCTNAFQALPDQQGRITVSLTRETFTATRIVSGRPLPPGPYARLAVTDTGTGIPAIVRERLFDPFFTTKAVGQGTGLGLSVVHGIVENHDGAIEVVSDPGRGSTFAVYLPLLAEPAGPEPALPEPEAPPGGKGRRILLVDDEADLLSATAALLERGGYAPTAIDDPVRALRLFAADPDRFDLVITDRTMPKLTGLDLAREIARIRPGLPVLLATGYGDPLAPEALAAAGIVRCLAKPLSGVALRREIDAVLKEVAATPPLR